MKKVLMIILMVIFGLSCCYNEQNMLKVASMKYRYTNHLIKETSPYLLQHAHNPVDWYPWSDDAFNLAIQDNKPIFLSVGYASCHWCHVMERESFENEEIAAYLNKHFICIKVDKEERPDIDRLYMQFIEMISGSGGWPMTVFLTPRQEPYFGGAYFPPEDRYGKPGLKKVLPFALNYYKKDKDKLQRSIRQVLEAYGQIEGSPDSHHVPALSDFTAAVQKLSMFYEHKYGGIGHAPKFPAVQVLYLFLFEYNNSRDKIYLEMVEHTLKNMANGGIYDQLGGGFSRYSTDEQWLVPHFEKMLYDNALLSELYFDTFTITKDSFYLNIALDILSFVKRELRSPEGGFYSRLDADSEGKEGEYYIWTKDEIIKILSGEESDIFCDYYDITFHGNFEGRNVLHVVSTVKKLAEKYKLPENEIKRILNNGKNKLFRERDKRAKPARDDKIITAWNALILSAFAKAYQLTGKEEYKLIIIENIYFVRRRLIKNGELQHTFTSGKTKYLAFADDYAFQIKALLDCYEALFDESYLKLALSLSGKMTDNFFSEEQGVFYYTSRKQIPLLTRLKTANDNSLPSATGVMLMNLLRLSTLRFEDNSQNIIEGIFRKNADSMLKSPYSFSSFWQALYVYQKGVNELVVVYDIVQNTRPFLRLINDHYIPGKVVHLIEERIHLKSSIPRKMVKGRVTVYICNNFSCSAPITKLSELKEKLM